MFLHKVNHNIFFLFMMFKQINFIYLDVYKQIIICCDGMVIAISFFTTDKTADLKDMISFLPLYIMYCFTPATETIGVTHVSSLISLTYFNNRQTTADLQSVYSTFHYIQLVLCYSPRHSRRRKTFD